MTLYNQCFNLCSCMGTVSDGALTSHQKRRHSSLHAEQTFQNFLCLEKALDSTELRHNIDICYGLRIIELFNYFSVRRRILQRAKFVLSVE